MLLRIDHLRQNARIEWHGQTNHHGANVSASYVASTTDWSAYEYVEQQEHWLSRVSRHRQPSPGRRFAQVPYVDDDATEGGQDRAQNGRRAEHLLDELWPLRRRVAGPQHHCERLRIHQAKELHGHHRHEQPNAGDRAEELRGSTAALPRAQTRTLARDRQLVAFEQRRRHLQ